MRQVSHVLAFAIASLMFNAPVAAQNTVAKPVAKPAAKAPARPTKPAARQPSAPPVEVPLAKAEAEQLTAAALAYYGDYNCELAQSVHISTSPKNDGYIDVRFKTQTWTMKPVLSSTGALRLEDVKGRMLMIQIANKSMLLDAKIGQRIVDECVHETQRAAIAALAAAAASQPAGAGLLQAPVVAATPAAAAAAASAAASAPEGAASAVAPAPAASAAMAAAPVVAAASAPR
ncbi:MAG: hypothetical protein V4792_09655 [Pseudomonadota bacterium]